MRIVIKHPGCRPEEIEAENTLESLQKAVGGHIETVTFAKDMALICNEEGRLRGLETNCTVFGISFVGPILAIGIDGAEFRGLDDEELRLALKLLDK